jgi:hypothetical protein
MILRKAKKLNKKSIKSGLILSNTINIKKLKVKQCLIQNLKIHLNPPSPSKNHSFTKLLKKLIPKSKGNVDLPRA